MDISSENTSFNYLRSSPDFLNQVINNISSCVLLLDQDMKLQAFNDAMSTIFSNTPNEYLLYQKCGNAIGCAVAVENEAECGQTEQCCSCLLRKAAIMTYAEGVIYHKNRIRREFFTKDGKKVMKHLQYSTRRISFNQDNYVMVIIDDLTDLVEKDELIKQQESLIRGMREQFGTGNTDL